MKKLISILLVVLMMAGISLPAFANGQDNTTAAPLQFNADGQFSVMHVTDTHLDDDNVDASVWLIAAACDREQPDLVVITGDNVQNCDDANKATSTNSCPCLKAATFPRQSPSAITIPKRAR